MRIAFDTNVLIYSEGADDPVRQSIADDLIVVLRHHEFVLPVQVVAELHRFLTRRKKLGREAALDVVQSWLETMSSQAETTSTVLASAIGLATQHHVQIFDAIVLAASAEAGCSMLLSEDMQDGFVWRGVTVVNPFAAERHPLLADALRG